MNIKARKAVFAISSPPEKIISVIFIVFHGRIKEAIPAAIHTIVEI